MAAVGALETSAAPPVKVGSLNRKRPLGPGRMSFCSCP